MAGCAAAGVHTSIKQGILRMSAPNNRTVRILTRPLVSRLTRWRPARSSSSIINPTFPRSLFRIVFSGRFDNGKSRTALQQSVKSHPPISAAYDVRERGGCFGAVAPNLDAPRPSPCSA